MTLKQPALVLLALMLAACSKQPYQPTAGMPVLVPDSSKSDANRPTTVVSPEQNTSLSALETGSDGDQDNTRVGDSSKAGRPDIDSKRGPVASESQSGSDSDSTQVVWTSITEDIVFATDIEHPRMQPHIREFAKAQFYFNRVMKRAAPYIAYIAQEIDAKGMPAELALLPFIESAYDPFAYSTSSAAGLWQFIPSTAKHLGLPRNWWYDGRRDILESTETALSYLSYLHRRFDGDWLLALAAYNGGEGTVKRAIARNRAKGLPEDFWSLKLSAETRDYVPRFLALTKVVAAPDEYGLEFPHLDTNIPFRQVKIDEQIDLYEAARLAGIKVDRLYKLNPGFKRRATPPNGKHNILLPHDRVEHFKHKLATTPRSQWRPAKEYIVQPGDTLGEIAERYHVSTEALMVTNTLSSPLIRDGQVLRIPGSGVGVSEVVPNFINGKARYRVRRGDTLWSIAKNHMVSLRDIRRWNSLEDPDFVKPGQYLIVRNNISGQGERVKYSVKKGDSLARISREFNIAVADIVKWNNLKNRGIIYPGQKLVLYPRS
ncbi:MAG TPA: lytic transglycosylase [Porticoccaceae bacterium]|nr:lytic transglycosylase [Porticoccaceae bacterium]